MTEVAYIAGPMAGRPDFNFPAFLEAEAWLTEHTDWDIVNPARMDKPGEVGIHSRAWCLRRDLTEFFRHKVTQVVRLEDWSLSIGASVETVVGEATGCDFWTFYPEVGIQPVTEYEWYEIYRVHHHLDTEYFGW